MNRLGRLAVVVAAVVSLLAAPSATAMATPAPADREPRSLLCTVSVQRLAGLWDGLMIWAPTQKQSGDALADAMSQMLGSSDPSDLEVVEMQKENARVYLASVQDFRAHRMRDDLKEILFLGSQIRGSVKASQRAYVKGRIAKIHSLYKEYWYDLFAPTYARGYQALAGTDVTGWNDLTAPLAAKVPIAGTEFRRAFRGLRALC